MVNKVELNVNREFLENYRLHQLDLLDDATEPLFEYTVLTHFLNKGNQLSELFNILDDDNSELILDVTNNIITPIANKNYDRVDKILGLFGDD